jgi:hypothetical protein
MEVIIRQESAVKDHEAQSPPTVGLKAGAFADVGTLILTNKRLVYINKGGAATALAWGVGGVFMAQAIEQSVSKAQLDEATTQPGSYSTPLENITRAQAGKKMGQSFVTVENVGSPKPVHAYVVGGNNNNELWATTINQAKMALKFAPKVQAPPFVSQQAAISQTNCPRCGATNGGSKFCTSCGTPLTQNPNNLPLPPPPPQTQPPMCPYCRNPIRYIAQYQRWYCDKEKRYV